MPGRLPDGKQNTEAKTAALPKGQPKKVNTGKTSPIGQDLLAVETHTAPGRVGIRERKSGEPEEGLKCPAKVNSYLVPRTLHLLIE